MKMKAKIFVALIALATLSACAHRESPEPAAISHERAFLDIQPGWRIRVVTPILKSGTFKVQTQELQSSEGAINLKVSDDFEGYETDFYMARGRDPNGISVVFVSAEVRDNNGNHKRKPKPMVPLFFFPREMRFVRLLFLTRVSQAEHNQAILAATSLAAIEQLTRRVTLNPDEQCRNSTAEACLWVPEGI